MTTRVAQPRTTTSEAPAWMDRLEADHENMRQALGWLAETGQWPDALRLATALCPCWDVRGYLTEGRAWLELTLSRSRAEVDAPGLRAEATANLGVFLLRQGDYEQAETLLEDARNIWIQSGDAANLAWLLMFLGGVAEYREDDERARSWYAQALAGFREQDNVAGVSDTLNNLADTAYRCADLGEAERLAQEASAIGRTTALPVQIGAALVTIGAIACARGTWDRAVGAHREALRLSRDAAHELNLADAFAGLAEVAAVTNDPARAARLLGAVETMTDRLGVPRLPHQALHRKAIAATQARLDPMAFAAAVAAGRSLSQDDAIAEAERVSGIPAVPAIPASGRFTRREADVLRLLVAGDTDRAIGEALYIGTRTVESHVARIFEKLGVRTRAAAVTAALTSGLVDPPPPDPSASED